jgi:hypothetical protein
MNQDSRKKFVSLCCNGAHCRGNYPSTKTFFKFIPGMPVETKIIVWLRLGYDKAFVRNPEPPSSDVDHCRFVEALNKT